MFGLARRPSVGSATSPTSGPKSPPAPAPGSPPLAPALSVCSPSGPAADELATTPRRSNNDKLRTSHGNSNATTTTSMSGLTSGVLGSPSVSLSPRRSTSSSPSMKMDGDPSNGNGSNGVRKLLRSPTADPTHLSLHRSISRDFALTVAPFATMGHENCSSLRDQFLRIRERFSGAAPSTSGSSSSSSSGSSSNRVAPEQQQPQTKQPKPQPPKHSQQSLASVAPSPVVVSASNDGATSTSSEPSVVSVPTELVLAELNQRTRRLSSSGDLLWAQHAHVERWYVEDNFFRGSMTCWTIERGSEIVSRIAKVVSSRSVGGRVNPDVSLQWIGRQLWAVTISLPLTRSGELTNEHASLARAIDDAVAVADDALRAPSPAPPPVVVASAAPAHASHSTESEVRLNPLLDTAAATITLAAATLSPSATNEQEEEEDEEHAEDATSTSAPPMGRAVASNSSVSTVAAEEEAREVEGRASRSLTTQEESDTVSALPISWSMLSFSSLQSGGEGTISVHGTESRDEDARVAPDKTGWLKKKNGLNSWQPRYFELKGNRLYYFATESEGIPRGAIIMDHAHVLRGKGEHSMTFTITASSKQQSLQIIKFSHRMTHQVHPYVAFAACPCLLWRMALTDGVSG
ncbi:hypothetical protein PINS_up010003 [Pythium insidiosum]|nr:hypothetical protein PINS_up010003 [Pythium insidiosum]